jgi:hypothetical protein
LDPQTNSMKIFTFLAALVLFASCTPFKLHLSDELQTRDEYQVKGKQGILINQKMSFGEYATSKVSRSWTTGHSPRIGWYGVNQQEWVNIISINYIDKKQTLHFGMADKERESEIFCVSRFSSSDLQVGKRPNSLLNIGLDLAGPSSSIYYVQVYEKGGGGIPWQLALDNQRSQSDARSYSGVFAKNEKEYYTLTPVWKLEKNGKTGNMPFGSVGYEIRNAAGKAVAAVSMMDKGMVYLGRTTASERFLMANLCAALLLQENIE